MTVVPGSRHETVSLVCDSCGAAIENIECLPEHWPVIWSVVSRAGWAGTPVAIGPHHCPQCGESGKTSPRAAPAPGKRDSRT